jgi:hypothetical protein
MTMTLRLVALAVCALVGSGVATTQAGNIPLVNPTFDTPAQNSFVAAAGSFLGWTNNGGAGVLNYTASSGSPTTEAPYWPTVPAGTTFAYSNGDNLTQITTDPLGMIKPGTTYQLQVNVGEGNGFGPTNNTISLIAADGTILKSATTGNSVGFFTTETLSYTAPLSGSMLGQQIGVVLGSSGVQSNFDNVVLSTVPEPGALGMLGCGAVGLSWLMVRRRAQATRQPR